MTLKSALLILISSSNILGMQQALPKSPKKYCPYAYAYFKARSAAYAGTGRTTTKDPIDVIYNEFLSACAKEANKAIVQIQDINR